MARIAVIGSIACDEVVRLGDAAPCRRSSDRNADRDSARRWLGGGSVAGEWLRWVVITAGSAGARAVSATEVLDAPADRINTVDTTGAGDAFAAGLVHALVSGSSMPEALATGVRFGSEAVRWPRSRLPAHAVHRLL